MTRMARIRQWLWYHRWEVIKHKLPWGRVHITSLHWAEFSGFEIGRLNVLIYHPNPDNPLEVRR